MRDRREEILDRLKEIGNSVPGIVASFRNLKSGISQFDRPAFLIEDGDENSNDLQSVDGIKFSGVNMLLLTPKITILVSGEDSPSTLARLRMSIIDLVSDDPTLKAITGSNGGIRYLGCATTDEIGQRIEGYMKLEFVFKYPLLAQEYNSA